MGELDEPSVIDSPVHERIGDSEAFEPLEPSSRAEEVRVPPKKRQRRRGFAWLLGIAALMLVVAFVVDQKPTEESVNAPAKPHQAPPVPVTVADVSQHDMPVYLDGLGTVQASNTVAVHSQVDGKLQSVNFVEGQRVKAGDVLAIVDPRPFQAALDQAKAKKAQDEAQLVSDAKDLARFQDLMKKGAGTAQAVDQQQAKVDALKATIASDQAGIENAETQLSYATIRGRDRHAVMGDGRALLGIRPRRRQQRRVASGAERRARRAGAVRRGGGVRLSDIEGIPRIWRTRSSRAGVT